MKFLLKLLYLNIFFICIFHEMLVMNASYLNIYTTFIYCIAFLPDAAQ